MPERPPLALLLDVDGPISNPDAKRIVEPTIVGSMATLLDRGVPIVLNTGRSAAFVRERVFAPVVDARPSRLDLFHAVCEKGAVWLSAAGDMTEEIDTTIAVPADLEAAVRQLVEERYSTTTFFDETKHAMISTERTLDTSHERYVEAQRRFIGDAFELVAAMGYGITDGTRHRADASGNVPYRIDPTIIATDIESVKVGKDLGARRAVDLLLATDVSPAAWSTVGDSDTDYAMADWLHDNGHRVAHVDVRPAGGLSRRTPYPVERPSHSSFDDAGALYLRWLVATVGTVADHSPDLG